MAIGIIASAVGTAASVAGGIINSRAQARAAASQREWNRYNAVSGHNNVVSNVATRNTIASFNAEQVRATGDIQSAAIRESAGYNARMGYMTSLYNANLLEAELDYLWQAVGLDLRRLDRERSRERGEIIANQAASGTVIGEGTNALVLMDQAQEAELDAFVIRHGANIQASKIMNAAAGSLWEGENELKRVIWEGEVAASINDANTTIRETSIIGSSAIDTVSTLSSARDALMAGMGGAEVDYSASTQSASNTLVAGLFSGAQQGLEAYYRYKTPRVT